MWVTCLLRKEGRRHWLTAARPRLRAISSTPLPSSTAFFKWSLYKSPPQRPSYLLLFWDSVSPSLGLQQSALLISCGKTFVPEGSGFPDKSVWDILVEVQSASDTVKSTHFSMTKWLYYSLKSSEKEFGLIRNTTHCSAWGSTRPLPACLEWKESEREVEALQAAMRQHPGGRASCQTQIQRCNTVIRS